ncbi:MAG: alpha-amylase [Erysipelotrichaceae bacterium]|nr:alpha-amylase [Erysipelotrichaceae bacterium]
MWYQKAVFYHIYPLGLCGAPEENTYETPVSRIKKLYPWIDHLQKLGCNALYIGPLFESGRHGYDTTDYYRTDSRLGTNEDLKELVQYCHQKEIRVIFDGVFNHTGRDFFAFRDLKQYRESSRYRSWYSKVNFYGNNEFNDGFSYEAWGGYNILPRLNQQDPEVRDYLCNVVRWWVKEFDIDGLRLDAADVLDFDFMRALRRVAEEVKEDFWLMGEVIHGDYGRWVNGEMLHSVTDYALHKALYSGHNDHNYFEIAHTVKRQRDLCGDTPLYHFVDNHDVERIMSKLNNKAHYVPVHILLYTLPGIPSLYYGSEFGIEGKKGRGSDAPLRPCLELSDFGNAYEENACTQLIAALGKIHREVPELSYGNYRELLLRTGQFAFCRDSVIVAVNNADSPASFDTEAENGLYRGALHGEEITVSDGRLRFSLAGCDGEIWLKDGRSFTPVSKKIEVKEKDEERPVITKEQRAGKSYEEMSVEELQAEILEKMARNGPVSDQMKRDVYSNIWRDSLLNWVKSFR